MESYEQPYRRAIIEKISTVQRNADIKILFKMLPDRKFSSAGMIHEIVHATNFNIILYHKRSGMRWLHLCF